MALLTGLIVLNLRQTSSNRGKNMNKYDNKPKVELESIVESAAILAINAIRQSKSPLFAYPGSHFYLTQEGRILPNTTKQIARNDASSHSMEKIQQHLLAYPPPQSAGFHVLAIACNEDLTPHCAVSYEPKLIRVAFASVQKRMTIPILRQYWQSGDDYLTTRS